jgi:hypothetical protein
MYLFIYVFNRCRGRSAMTKIHLLESTYLSFDDVCILLQLADMATTALDRRDFSQLDVILKRISDLRERYARTRLLIDTLSRRRGIGPATPHG